MVAVINPANGLPLRRFKDDLIDDVGNRFPIIGGIPRICPVENYAASFGMQWNKFDSTQVDLSRAGPRISEQRLFVETGWDANELSGKDILEVGSGAGRFTRIILERTAARLWSLDYSTSVEANLRNNGAIAPERLNLFQASVYEMPFPDNSFDKVFCFGVLQHTADFEASVRALVQKTKRGGEIVADFYPIKGWWTKLNAKYALRPMTRRMSNESLLRLVDRNIDWMMKFHRLLIRSGMGLMTRFLPIADLRSFPTDLTPEQLREWTVLDTFDMLAPKYDNPQRIRRVVEMFERAGARVTFADFVYLECSPAAVVRAIRV